MNEPTGPAAEGTHPVVQLLLTVRKVVTKGLEWLVIIAVAVLTLDVLWGVFSRRILGNQSRWTEELARVLLIWVALLGTSVAFAEKGHLGVDVFVRLMDRGAQRLVRIVVHLIVIYFAASVMVWGGLRGLGDATTGANDDGVEHAQRICLSRRTDQWRLCRAVLAGVPRSIARPDATDGGAGRR